MNPEVFVRVIYFTLSNAQLGATMHEGWYRDDYLILFDESEIIAASDRYQLERFLPGFKLLGLRSWDDFIVRNISDQTFSVPILPLDAQYLSPLSFPEGLTILKPDTRFSRKIKWYLKPIVFGGDAGVGENLVWVSHEEHAQLVKFWNDKYRALKSPPSHV